METHSLQISGTPSLWTFVFVHPWLSFAVVVMLILTLDNVINNALMLLAALKGEKK